MNKIPYTKPSITQHEVKYVTDAIKNGWGSRCYEYIKRFETEFGEYIGCKYCESTSSCTGALTLALAAAGVKKDDEVIVPDITWVASATTSVHLGAKPVFVDVIPETWCIDPDKIEKEITKKTKAIVVVHLYGNLAEMAEILAIAKKHNLIVIEDAAEAIGSEYKGKKAGSIGDIGVFSFHGTKTMTTGEGGMLVTNNESLFQKVKMLNDQGRDPKIRKAFWSQILGYKFKMSNLQAALGVAQLERLDELIKKKREIFEHYKKRLSDVKGILLNPEQEYAKNSYWMPTVIFDKSLNIDREKLIAYFKEKNVDIRPFFYPISMFPFFETKKMNVVSYDIYKRGINLPSFPDMTREEIDYVCENLKEYLNINNTQK